MIALAKDERVGVPFLIGERKIKLSLRTREFSREMGSLPRDVGDLHRLMMGYRADKNEAIYDMVSAWNKLRVNEEYYQAFGFGAEGDYLAFYGLPEGATLAGWTVMVNIFDKDTFVFLGDDILGFMMRAVGMHQNGTDARKKDYQAIFDAYSKMNDAFDKTEFYRTIRVYLDKRYGNGHVAKSGVHHVRKVVSVEPAGQRVGPTLRKDFAWAIDQCRQCKEKDATIEAFKRYCRALQLRLKEAKVDVPLPPNTIKELL